MAQPTILIAMPLYQGWEHVGQTLDSIAAQSFGNFRVLISVDGGDTRSRDACLIHLQDERFELVVHEEHLGWGANMTWLGEQLREDYFCYWQHDDFCDPSYLEKLVAHAERNPRAASVYCDMEIFGTFEKLVQLPSVTGFALQRVFTQINAFNPAVFRCLVRADALRASLPIQLAATWCMALARAGELHRVPELLYFRRIRPKSLTHTMPVRPDDVLWQESMYWGLGVLRHTRGLIEPGEHDRLFAMIADYLINRRQMDQWQYDFPNAGRAKQLAFLIELMSEAETELQIAPVSWPLDHGQTSALKARRASAHLWPGEDLVIDAILTRHDPHYKISSQPKPRFMDTPSFTAIGPGRRKPGLLRRISRRLRGKRPY